MNPRREPDTGNVTTGYLILSGLSVILFALAFKDPMYIVFGIPIILVFTLAASGDKTGRGSVDEDLEAIGWTDKGMEIAIPLGVIGGMATLFLGSLMTRYTPETASILVPDFSNIAMLTTASVIPPTIALAANIISQWLVVAPSEEALARVLAPYAGIKIFKNAIIAFIFAAFFWMGMHIPTFLAQGANQSMYLVILLLAAVTTVLYIITKVIISSITAHGTFNTGVLLASGNFDTATMYVVFTIAAILIYAWITGFISSRKAG